MISFPPQQPRHFHTRAMQRHSLDHSLSVIAQVKISSTFGSQSSYLPLFCELHNTTGVHTLSFSTDDGSGDKEMRSFTLTAPKVETKNKGSLFALHITTPNDVTIKILFSSASTMKTWASVLQGLYHQGYQSISP